MFSTIILIISIFLVVAYTPRIIAGVFGVGKATNIVIIIWATAITAIITIKFVLT